MTDALASLYVGDLDSDVTEVILFEAFAAIGAVASCHVCRDSVTRRSLCYGFVNYYSHSDAERALETLNYTQIKGKICRVMWSQRDPQSRRNPSGNIFVKNLDESIDNKLLHDTFSAFGNILSCKVALDSSGRSKGHGFVHYEAEEAAKQAIAHVNGMQIGGRKVFVGPFLRREELEIQDHKNFTNLYVKHFPSWWGEEELGGVFHEFGEIVSLVIMSKDEDRRKFALVNYRLSASAKAAIEALHRKDLSSSFVCGETTTADAGTDAKRSRDGDTEGGVTVAMDGPLDHYIGTAAGSDIIEASKCDNSAAPTTIQVANGPSEAEIVTKEADSTVTVLEEDATIAIAEPSDRSDLDDTICPDDGLVNTRSVIAGEVTSDEGEFPENLLYVKRAQTRAERQERYRVNGRGRPVLGVRLCVRNLSKNTTAQNLRELFEPHGTVLNSLVRTDGSGKCRSVGFVVLSSVAEATEAVKEKHLCLFNGKHLNVGLAERRRPRQDRSQRDDGYGSSVGCSGSGGLGKGKGKSKSKNPKGILGTGCLSNTPPDGVHLPPYLPGGSPNLLATPGSMPRSNISLATSIAGGVMPSGPTWPIGYRPPLAVCSQGVWPPTQMHPTVQAIFSAAARPAPMDLMQAMVPTLMGMRPQIQKQQLGERLYPRVCKLQPDNAGKITGMMLDLDVNTLLAILGSDDLLKQTIDEAVALLAKRTSASS